MKRQASAPVSPPTPVTIPLLYKILPPFILSIIAALVYRPSLNYEFQFDDIANITKHFDIRHNSLKGLWFSGTRWISYWLNSIHYSIGKFDPYSYRVGNVLIHSTNGLLVFFVLLTALSNLKKQNFFKQQALGISFLSALLFLIHPVQTQTVSYVIQGELEGLATLFILSMALCFIKLAQTQQAFARFALTILLFCLALFSCGTKEVALISPLLILIVDWFLVAQGNWKSLKSRITLHALLTCVIAGMYLWFLKASFFTKILSLDMLAKNNLGNVITSTPDAMITPWSFFISQFKVILHYLWMFIWPFNISVEYDWVLCKSFVAPDCIIPLIGLLCIFWALFKVLRNDPANLVAFGAIWFFTCMAPRSSIIPSPELLVDYKTYIASFGWLFIIAAVVIYGFTRLITVLKNVPIITHQQLGPVLMALVLAAPIGYYTVQRNKVWSSGLDFWENVIQNAPGKARAYNNYGVELSQKLFQFEKAIPYFEKAIAMDAKYSDPCNNLAVAYAQLDKLDQAIAALRQGLTINPYYPEGYNNLASFMLQKKDLDQAEQCLNIALKLRPHYGKAYFNMGRLHIERGNQEKAWECFKNACTKGDLDNEIGFATYAKMSLTLNKFDDAIYGFQKTLVINPYYPEGRFNLANALFLAKKFEQAAQVYGQVIAQNQRDGRSWFNKGEAHLMLKQPDKALECFKTVAKLPQPMVTLPLRLAACYDMLGNRQQAQQELIGIINNSNAPGDMRQLAKTLLAQFNKQGILSQATA